MYAHFSNGWTKNCHIKETICYEENKKQKQALYERLYKQEIQKKKERKKMYYQDFV